MFQKLAGPLSILIFSSSLMASPPQDFNQRFVTMPEIQKRFTENPGEKPTAWDRNLSAVDMITIYTGKSSETCTTTKISNDGYILLNLHCLTDCLQATAQELSGHDGKFKDRPLLYKFDQKKSVGRVCSVSIGKPAKARSAKVVALGRGYIDHSNAEAGFSINRAEYYSWLETFSDDNDYAILKVKKLNSTTCASLSKSPLQVDDKVWTLAFPSETSRDDGSKIPGDQKLFTSGYVRTKFAPTTEQTSPEQASMPEPIPPNDGEGLFSSSLDVAPGASGAAIFNEQGEIAGILRGESPPLDKNSNLACSSIEKCGYRDGMAEGLDAQVVARNILRDFGSQVLNQAFHCQ